jgi:LmbE family N-acetylglucosaminyl deacetylase
MPIEPRGEMPVALFLFAHQDDEFGVFPVIDDCLRRGTRVVCAYLTRGPNGIAPRRNAESTRVLTALGVNPEDILFAGDQLGIDDTMLLTALERADAWIVQWFSSFAAIERIHVLAWEGGHHDHDALHALAAQVADRLGLLARLRQFALYNGYRCPGPLFRVLAPLAANGPVESFRIPLSRRLVHLRSCLQYPSQRMTWVGLFPFVLLHYIIRGRQSLQAVRLERIEERPHADTLYYEARKFCTWEQMQATLREWRRTCGEVRGDRSARP